MDSSRIFVAEKNYQRLDIFLAEMLPELSKNKVKNLIQNNKVLLNGNPTRAGVLIKTGDIAEILEFEEKIIPGERKETAKKLKVVFEDEFLLVADKERGMPSILLTAEDEITVADLACNYCESCKEASTDSREGGLVQRLDYWTSGAIIIAKSRESFSKLRELIQQNAISKSYLAVVERKSREPLKKKTIVVNSPIKLRRGANRVEVLSEIPQEEEKDVFPAETKIEILAEVEDGFLILKASGESMRRHQVRAHLSFAGFPLAGDELYGAGRKLNKISYFKELQLQGFYLHASTLSFKHPFSNKKIDIKIPSELEKNGIIGK